MLLQKALRLDEGARFKLSLLHPKKLRSDHIKRVGCFRARHRLLVGRVLAVRNLAKYFPGFPLGFIKTNLRHVPQCHAALFWADLVLQNIRSVFSLTAIADPQPEARHVVIELDMFELALGHLEFGYSGLRELHRGA